MRAAYRVPSRAMPSDPPMVRSRVSVPLAAPMSRGSALFIVISVVLCITRPIPAPMTRVSAEARAAGGVDVEPEQGERTRDHEGAAEDRDRRGSGRSR